MKVCPWCAEELGDDARRCTNCGRDPASRPTQSRPDPDGDRSWSEPPHPDPAKVYASPGRPLPADDLESDLRLLEPAAGREQPVNDKALRSSLLAAFGSNLWALVLARRAEQQIDASDGREGGKGFVTLTRVLVWSSLGMAALAILIGLVASISYAVR